MEPREISPHASANFGQMMQQQQQQQQQQSQPSQQHPPPLVVVQSQSNSTSSSPFSAAAYFQQFNNRDPSARFQPHLQVNQQQQQQHHHHHHHHLQHQQIMAQASAAGRSNSQLNNILLASSINNIHNPSAVRFPPSPTSNVSPNPNQIYPTDHHHHIQASSHSNMQIQHQMQAQNNMVSGSPPPTGCMLSSSHDVSSNTTMVLSRSADVSVKRKRGRPRKYAATATDADGAPLTMSTPLRGTFTSSGASPREKKAGKSKKAQLASLGATGQGFTPHVLSIGAGEDIVEKITNFSQHGPWAVCILSANGAISNASLWHGGISSGAVPYEGRFELLSLSGLFLLAENGQRNGSLSVSLAGPDGRVIGGRVAGSLRAASPVQVIIGTFFSESRKSQARAGNVSVSNASYMVPGNETIQAIEQGQLDQGHRMQDISNLAEEGNEHHVSHQHVMPLQSADWGASHYDVESRSHNEQMQSAHGGS